MAIAPGDRWILFYPHPPFLGVFSLGLHPYGKLGLLYSHGLYFLLIVIVVAIFFMFMLWTRWDGSRVPAPVARVSYKGFWWFSCCTGPCIYLLYHIVARRKLFKSSFRVCVSFVRPGTMPAASGTACTNKPFSRINALDLLLAGTPGWKLSGKWPTRPLWMPWLTGWASFE